MNRIEARMKNKNMRRIRPALMTIACVLLVVIALESAADAGDEPRTRWATARMQGVLTLPLGANRIEGWNECGSGWLDYLDFSSAIDINTSAGILASFEYVVARRYGFEIGFLYWNRIVNLQFDVTGLSVNGSPNFILPTFGLNYHVLADEKKDLYGGALCALGVVATGFFTDIEVSKDVALGINLGFDYYVKRSWSVGACIKYIDFGELDFSVLPEHMEGFVCDNGLFGVGHMNVVSVTCGLGYRF